MNPETPPHDDLKSRIDELDAARRKVGQSIAASGITLRRIMRERDMPLPADELPQPEESWPRILPPPKPPRTHPVALVVLTAVIVVGAVFQRHLSSRRAVVPSSPPAVRAAPAAVPVAAVSEKIAKDVPPVSNPPVIRVRAVRSCRVRITVDGTSLDWRQLSEGDEFVSRPSRAIILETSDPDALAATIDGTPRSLEEVNLLFQNPAK